MAARLWADEALAVAEVHRDEPVDFQEEILPLLRRNCLACHNASEPESDLVLETPQSILQGGSEGPGVVAGNADESLIFQLAAHRRESFMPPEENTVGATDFTPEELGLIKLWIDQGAKGEVASEPGAIAWQPLPSGFNPIYAVAVSPHGRFVAAGRANQIFMYGVPSQQELGRLTDPALLEVGLYQQPGVAHRDLVHSLAFRPSGEWLASGGFGTVKLWRREAGVRQEELPGAEGAIGALCVSPDGHMAAVAHAGGQIQLYDVASGKAAGTISDLPAEATAIAFSADGSRLVGGLLDRSVRLWDVVDEKEIGNFESPAAVTAVAVSSDGKRIIIGGGDHVIRTWVISDGSIPPAQQEQSEAALKEIQGHTAEIVALAPLPNHPSQFVSASLDSTARLWDAESGEQVSLFNHGAPLRYVSVRADGGRIATGAETGTAKLWNTQDGQPVAELTSDSDQRYESDDLQLAIELARLQVRNAQSDLDEAIQRKQAEAVNADKAAVELVRANFEAKQKAEVATAAIAEKENAEKELAALQTELADAETTKQNAAEQTREQAERALSEIAQKIQAVEQQVAKLRPPAQRAVDERESAEGAVEAAERAVARSKEAVTLAAAEVPLLKQSLIQRKQEQKAAEDHLAQTQQSIIRRNARLHELENAKVAADQVSRDMRDQTQAAQAAHAAALRAFTDARETVLGKLAESVELDAAAQATLDQTREQLRAAEIPIGGAQATADAAAAFLAALERELAEAKAAVAAAEDDAAKATQTAVVEFLVAEQTEAAKRSAEAAEQLQAATAQQSAAAEAFAVAAAAKDAAAAAARQAAENAQELIKAATDAKVAADQAATEADARSKAATAAKEAADTALAAAQEKLTQTEEEEAIAVAEVEVQNALGNQATADKEAAEAATGLQNAGEAKAAAEKGLADATTEAQRIQDAANQSLAEAQQAYQEAHGAFAQADTAAGGWEARAATAAQIKAAADAALAEVRAPIRAVSFSPDGTQLCVVREQGQVHFYSSETGEPLHQLSLSGDTPVAAACLSGERLLTAANDRSLVVWATTPTWTLQRKIGSADFGGQLTDRVTALDFSPSGEWLATGGGEPSRSGEVNLWNVETGQLLRAIPEAHSDVVLGVAFSPDGKYLASCGADRFMKVFEVETGDLVKSFEGHTHHVLGVSWRADGRLLATSGADNLIKVWDFMTGEQIRTIEGFNKEITAIEFLGASDNFVISTGSKQVATRNIGGGGGPDFSGATDFMYDVGVSRDGKLVVAAGQDSVLRVWDQQGNSIVTFAPPPSGEHQPSGDDQPATSDQAGTP